MNRPSLKSLLDRADELIKGSSAVAATKEAQDVRPRDQVDDVAEVLVSATAPVAMPAGSEGWTEIEKTAMALNVLNAASEVDMIKRMEKFAAAARAEGYSDDQICEAMTKISAGKVAENLGTLVAMGVEGFGKDKNSKLLARRKLPVGIGRQPVVPNAKGLGY